MVNEAGDKPQLLIDCDPGHDDVAALVVANHFADIVGITTVGGNAPLDAVTRNALIACQVFGIDADVHSGCARPLIAEPMHATEIHGESGFAGPELPDLRRSVVSEDAAAFLVDKIRSTEGLWLVVLGPMTNVAYALQAAPDIVDRLAGISFMGGSASIGNRTPVAEFNVAVDPEAASIVMKSGVRLRMAGLDLTQQFPVDDELVVAISALDGVGPRLLAASMSSYLDAIEVARGTRRGGLHDPCAVLAVTHPELISYTKRHVVVELSGAFTRGMTVVDQRENSVGDLNVEHGHTIEAAQARQVFLAALGA